MKKINLAIIILMLLSLLITGIGLAILPDVIPTHFGIDGQPDQFGSKYFVLLFTAIAIICGSSMLAVVKFASVTENYKKYLSITAIIVQALFDVLLVLFIIYALSYVENKPTIQISKIELPILGVLFIVLGNFMPKVERNNTLGIKTKWAKYNDITWQKTHRFTGYISCILGLLIIVISFFFNDTINFVIFVAILLIFTVSTTVASYVYYKQEKGKESQV